MERQAADDPVVYEEVAFWRGFISRWAQARAEPVPARAWQALERAQCRAEAAEATGSPKCHPRWSQG